MENTIRSIRINKTSDGFETQVNYRLTVSSTKIFKTEKEALLWANKTNEPQLKLPKEWRKESK